MKVTGLSVETQEGTRLISSLDFEVDHRGLILLGESGGGKSTILEALAGVSSHRIACKTNEFAQVDVALLVQNAEDALSPFRKLLGQLLDSKVDEQALLASLQRLGLDAGVCERYPHQLSGGMLKRLLVATLTQSKAPVVLFDEPTSGVDPSLRWLVWQEIMRIGKPWIVATHDVFVVGRFPEVPVAVVHQGKIVERGTGSSLLSHSTHPVTTRLLAPCRRNEPFRTDNGGE